MLGLGCGARLPIFSQPINFATDLALGLFIIKIKVLPRPHRPTEKH